MVNVAAELDERACIEHNELTGQAASDGGEDGIRSQLFVVLIFPVVDVLIATRAVRTQ